MLTENRETIRSGREAIEAAESAASQDHLRQRGAGGARDDRPRRRLGWSKASRRVSALTCAGAVVATGLAASAPPAHAATNHVWPVCSPKTSETGWRYSTRPEHSPSGWNVDVNWGSGSADRGRGVVASAAGVIVGKAQAATTSYGKYITLKHADGTFSRYAHLESWTSLGTGASVSQGQQIGTIGYSGTSTNPVYHLHYEQMHASGTNSPGSYKPVYINGARLTYYTSGTSFFPTAVRSTCPV